ncbi:hypothetical protein ACH4U5_37070 [Streptomyces sp. NPDC020858]|uniref:hypothetical protein n=1 Tax=Streptomyces sp. NPDC020858 TaxID=3365097 RepID=UPI0037BC5EAD
MSFEQEWAGHKQAAAEASSPQMRLNQVPADQGGSTTPGWPGVLATAPPEKTKAANTIQNVLEPGTTRGADLADEPTKNAVKAFNGWATATGLTKAHTHWDDQVRRLMARLASEKTGLRKASNMLSGTDQLTGQSFGPLLQSKAEGA